MDFNFTGTVLKIFTKNLLTIISFFILFVAIPSLAAEKKNDVRVLIDISGSMKKNDPGNLRQPALKLLANILPTGTHAGIWLFGDNTKTLIPSGLVNKQWKKTTGDLARKIHSRGLFTNIETALSTVTAGWETADQLQRRSIILLTDGVVDVSKNPAESSASKARILNQILPQLIDKKIAVHTIALSEHADQALMQRLSQATDGWFEIAKSADQLQRIFLRMTEKATRPDTLPIVGNQFSVDNSIDEMTILLFHSNAGSTITLVDPSGETLSADKHPTTVRWNQNESYDLITYDQPPPGKWQFTGATDPDNKVMIVTDLRAFASDLPNNVLPGTSFRFTAELTENGQRITRSDFLKLISMELEHRNETTEPTIKILSDNGLQPDDIGADGLFSANIDKTWEEGPHKLVLNISSDTFQRTIKHTFNVRWPVNVDLNKADGNDYYALLITAASDQINPETLVVTAKVHPPISRSYRLDLSKTDNHGFSATIETATEAGEYSLDLSIIAKDTAGRPIKLVLPAIPFGETVAAVATDKIPAPKGTNWILIGGATTGVLLIIAAGFMIFLKLRRRKQQEPLDGEQAESSDKLETKEPLESDPEASENQSEADQDSSDQQDSQEDTTETGVEEAEVLDEIAAEDEKENPIAVKFDDSSESPDNNELPNPEAKASTNDDGTISLPTVDGEPTDEIDIDSILEDQKADK